MRFVVDDFNSPRHRVSGDRKYTFVLHSIHQRTELFRLSPFNLCLTSFSTRWQMVSVYINTHPLYGISSPERRDLPLVIIRSTNHRVRKRTHQRVSLLNVLGRTTTHLLRVLMDVEVSPRIKVLDLVYPRLQFSVFEDEEESLVEFKVHSQDQYGNAENMRQLGFDRLSRALRACPRSHTMTTNSTSNSVSILNDGRIKPGIYKIQNIFSQTYLEIWEHSKELCCRPAAALEDGKGLVSSDSCRPPPQLMIFSGKSFLLGLDTPYAGWVHFRIIFHLWRPSQPCNTA
jgi:hypothetical protein